MADTERLKYMGLNEFAQSVYNLQTTGMYSVNELRRKRNEPRIDEPWADEHHMLLAVDKAVKDDNTID